MKASSTVSEAWTAVEYRDFERAEAIWDQILPLSNPLARQNFRLDYIFVLVLQQRFQEAEVQLRELHDQSHNGLCLHLLGWIAQTHKKFGLARAHYLAEQASLEAQDHAALAWNSYAISRLALEQYDLSSAARAINQSLSHARQTDDALLLSCAFRQLADLSKVLGETENARTATASSDHAFAKVVQPLELMSLDKRAFLALLSLSERPELNLALFKV